MAQDSLHARIAAARRRAPECGSHRRGWAMNAIDRIAQIKKIICESNDDVPLAKFQASHGSQSQQRLAMSARLYSASV